MINDIVFLGVDIVFLGVDIVFLGVYLVLLQLRLELIDFLLHDPGLPLDLSLDLGTKLGNPLLDVFVDCACLSRHTGSRRMRMGGPEQQSADGIREICGWVDFSVCS